MPVWKYLCNRLLTAFENILLRAKLSELPHRIPRVFQESSGGVATFREFR